jgi:hypothetical protein
MMERDERIATRDPSLFRNTDSSACRVPSSVSAQKAVMQTREVCLCILEVPGLFIVESLRLSLLAEASEQTNDAINI